MAKFTLILEFRGDISIRQVEAASPQAALRKLVRRTDAKTKLFRVLADKKAVAIEGLTNCWYSSAPDRGKFAVIIIVRTDE
ncbi:MAG: hypothetical protein ABSA54_16125 [Terriglobales bacterium]|jgi:hypothetical protein